MKSKASYFSISLPLVKENLRRFWAIPALSFLVFFFSGIFPILMSYKTLNNLSYYIHMSLTNQQPFYMFAHLLFPIITAVVIFRYLQSISSVAMMHSMPFTRQKLFNSNFLSGIILIFTPILLNGIVLLLISKPVYSQFDSNGQVLANATNLFAKASVGNWIWESLLIVLIVYAVSVFAGIVTGNSLMHFLTAGAFNFLIPGLYVIFIAYFSYFLYGFDLTGDWEDIGLLISPYLNVFHKGGHFSIGSEVYYLLLFIALYIISSILYSRRKLEFATDTLTFKFMHPIISFLIAFLGMTALGFYFFELENTNLYLYAGFVAGAIIFFIIGRMIILKSPRVFNLKSLQNFGIYAVIAVIFITALNFDITGFETRIPEPSKVKSFTLNQTLGYQWGNHPSYGYQNEKTVKLRDPENILAMAEFHKSIIDYHKKHLKDESESNNYTGLLTTWVTDHYTIPFTISYQTGSKFKLSRNYKVDYNFFQSNPYAKKVYESTEYKNFYSFKNFKYKEIKGIYLNSEALNGASVPLIKQNEITEFLACLEKDYQKQSFKDMISLQHQYATGSIDYTYINTDPEYGRLGEISNSLSIEIGMNYTNTIQWLRERGYAINLEEKIDNISSITFYHFVDQTDKINQHATYEPSKTKEVNEKQLVITDSEKIHTLLNNYETSNTDNLNYYYAIINYKSNLAEAYDKKRIDKYGDSGGPTIYFNGDNVPQYVIDYFK